MPTLPTDISIRRAVADDAEAVRALLASASLPLDGVPDDLAHFLVATQGTAIVGAIGLEHHGDAALLRSAVVSPSHRGSGIGEALTHAIIAEAKAAGAKDLVLLATTAAGWFPRFGFTTINRDDAPAALHESVEFKSACPASAVVMSQRLQ